MPFPEILKASVRRRAHLSCCLCKSMGVEVHHIVPQEDGGPDTEENAAPLCPSCHEIYGANPLKRKFIREARDLWYEICARRYGSDAGRLDEIDRLLRNIETHVQTSTFPLLPFALFYTLRHTSTQEVIEAVFGKSNGYRTANSKVLKMIGVGRLGGARPYNFIDAEPQHSHCVLKDEALAQLIERHSGGESAIKSPNKTMVDFFFQTAADLSSPSLSLAKIFPGDGKPREVKHLELFDEVIFQDAFATGWEVKNPSKRAWSTADLAGARVRLSLKYISYLFTTPPSWYE